MNMGRIEHVHFIGIGGVGMSGIARVAFDQGMRVSGSDLKESRYTKQLKEAGIDVRLGHDAANLPAADDAVVVVSTAILENNPELIAARERGLAIWHRAQMLAHLGARLETLAVAGTHGKTTTSSMLASTLDAMGEDPTFLIGGIVRALTGTNAHSGTGRALRGGGRRERQVVHVPLAARRARDQHRGRPPRPLPRPRRDLREVLGVHRLGARGRGDCRRVRRGRGALCAWRAPRAGAW